MFPSLSPLSWVALAVMVLALGAALSRRFLATGALLVGNLAVFLLCLAEPTVRTDLWLDSRNLTADHALIGALQIFSSMFVHADFFHILGNMIFLWAFGMPFEERIGHRRFIAIYLVSGVAGVGAQYLWTVAMGESYAILLGASAAIFGIMCAFAAKYPNQVVAVPVPLIIFFLRMRVLYGALLWVGYNVIYAFALVRNPDGATGGVGYLAHLGGGLAGALVAVPLLRHVASTPGRGGPIPIDLVRLGDFAHDTPTREVLSHMRQNHDEPEVFQAWLDRFFRTATCPTCKHRVMPRHRGEVVCTQGHTFDVRQDRTQKLAPTPGATR